MIRYKMSDEFYRFWRSWHPHRFRPQPKPPQTFEGCEDVRGFHLWDTSRVVCWGPGWGAMTAPAPTLPPATGSAVVCRACGHDADSVADLREVRRKAASVVRSAAPPQRAVAS